MPPAPVGDCESALSSDSPGRTIWIPSRSSTAARRMKSLPLSRVVGSSPRATASRISFTRVP